MKVANALSQARRYTAKLFTSAPNHFIEHLEEQAYIVCIGTEVLSDYMLEPNRKNQMHLHHLELKADEVRDRLVRELNQSFVTPIDREDLFALSRAIDDVIDFAHSTINEMTVLQIAPNDHLRSMAQMLHRGAVEIHKAISCLTHEPASANRSTLQARALASQMETLYAEALSALFEKPDSLEDIVAIMKLMEMYRHMFRAVRSVKQAGDTIGDILIKFY
jgi:uncharacterized protein Yka (UPF0111/DUF47 family)